MNIFARSLVLLAVAGHIGLTLDEALARGPGGNSAGNSGGNSGSTGGHYGGSVGANGGHYGTVGVAGPNGGGGTYAPFPAPMAFGWPAPFTSFEANASACGPDLQLFDPGEFANSLDRVAAISQQTQSYVNFGGCATQDFVANALDKYADALQQIDQPAPDPQFGPPPAGIPPQHRLPREFRDLPRLIHEAATRVRKAETPHAAVKVLQAAIAFVQKRVDKTIALMRASDSDANVGASRGADLVADTLKAAADKLTRSDSL